MRLVFMGTPGLAVPVLESLLAAGHQIAAVYTQPDRPAGRGRQMAASPVKLAALENGLKVVEPESLKNEEEQQRLASLQPEVIVVAAYAKLLPKAVLEIPSRGCINVHPSLLPEHRGAAPIPATILAGDGFGGVSIMLMGEGLDTGPLLAQAKIPVADTDTTGSLSEKLSIIAGQMLNEVLVSWSRGEIEPRPQDDSLASYSSVISKADGEIDWTKPAEEIWRRVRALQPWPGAFSQWQGKLLKIIEALPLPAGEDAAPGQLLELPGNHQAAFGIATGLGMLGVVRAQLEGRKVMTSEELLRGQRQLIGAVLPS
jgi:methionyl-tRNA formyltransferase